MAADFQALVNDPDYQSLPAERQTAIRQDFFNSHVANDKDFQSLPPDRQTAVQQDIIGKPPEAATFTKTSEPQHGPVVQGLESIGPGIFNTAKQVATDIPTLIKGTVPTTYQPGESVDQFLARERANRQPIPESFAKGAAGGASMNIYQPETPTDPTAAAAQRIGQMVGFAAPFTVASRAAQAGGTALAPYLPKLLGMIAKSPALARMIAGGVTGAAEPISRGDIPGAIEQGVSGAGQVGVTNAAITAATAPVKAITSTLANRSISKAAGGAQGILKSELAQQTGNMPVEQAGQVFQQAGKTAAKAAGGQMQEARTMVPPDVTVPSSASEMIRQSLPETGPLRTGTEAKLMKLATDLDPNAQYISPTEANADFRAKVLTALGQGISNRPTTQEVAGYLGRLAQSDTTPPPVTEAQIVSQAKPAPAPAPEVIQRLKELGIAPETLVGNLGSAPTPAAAPTQQIKMGESYGLRGSELPLTAKAPAPTLPLVGASPQGQPAQNYLKTLAAAQAPLEPRGEMPVISPAQFRNKDFVGQAQAKLAELQQPAPGLSPEANLGVTFQELTSKRQALNRLYGQTRNPADKYLLNTAKNAVDADINKFRATYPDAVDKYYSGVKDWHEKVVPLQEITQRPDGTPEYPENVIAKFRAKSTTPIKETVTALESGGPEGQAALDQIRNGVKTAYQEHATEHGEFNPRKFLASVASPEDTRQLKALLGPDEFAKFDNFRQQLLDVGADKWTEGPSRGGGMWVRMHIIRAAMGLGLGNMFTVASQGGTAGIMYFGPALFQKLANDSRGAKLLAAGMMAQSAPEGSATLNAIAALAKTLGGKEAKNLAAMGVAAGNVQRNQQPTEAPAQPQAAAAGLFGMFPPQPGAGILPPTPEVKARNELWNQLKRGAPATQPGSTR